jgi:hypothetical protein
MSSGTAEIDRAVTSVVDSAAGMSRSIASVDAMVEGNNGAIDAVRRKADESLAELEGIALGIDDILRRAGQLRSLGQKSGSCMRDLDAAIRVLHDEGGSGGGR